jgi:hypothetical protein
MNTREWHGSTFGSRDAHPNLYPPCTIPDPQLDPQPFSQPRVQVSYGTDESQVHPWTCLHVYQWVHPPSSTVMWNCLDHPLCCSSCSSLTLHLCCSFSFAPRGFPSSPLLGNAPCALRSPPIHTFGRCNPMAPFRQDLGLQWY